MTFFYALLDPETGVLKYTNAGHNYPLLLRANGSVEKLAGGGTVLGLFPASHYELRETHSSGDTLGCIAME